MPAAKSVISSKTISGVRALTWNTRSTQGQGT